MHGPKSVPQAAFSRPNVAMPWTARGLMCAMKSQTIQPLGAPLQFRDGTHAGTPDVTNPAAARPLAIARVIAISAEEAGGAGP